MVQDIIGVGNITITDLNDSTISNKPPKNPEKGVIWIDSSGDKNVLKQFNGVEWVRTTLDVTQLDRDLSEKVVFIEATLGNIGDDGVLTHEDRRVLTEELNMIIGEAVSTSKTIKYPTRLPSYDTIDSEASGSFSNYRISAREVGIRRGNPEYELLERRYTELIRFLGQQGLPRPWDVREEAKGEITTLTDADEFRQSILDYYLAELALVTETRGRAQEMITSDTLSEDSGVTPFIAAPTQEGGAVSVEIQGFYKEVPTPVPEEYGIEVITQKVVKSGGEYTSVGETSRSFVPLPKVILEDESLVRGGDGKWKIATPTEDIVLTNTAQKALNNIPSYEGATKISLADTRIEEVKTLINVRAISSSWYREQKNKDYTDGAVNNEGSALDVREKGPYEIPEMPVARISEYTVEALVYWGGGDNSNIIVKEDPRMYWGVGAQEFTKVEEVNGELKERDPETRGYLEFSPNTKHELNSKDNIEDVYLPVKRWTGVAITYDGTETRLYIGGKLAADHSSGASLVLKNIMLGGLPEEGWFDGYISNFRIWDVALPSETIERYQNRRIDGDEDGLILYYRLNGGNMIYDSGPYRNHIASIDGVGWIDDKRIAQELEDEIQTVSTQVTQLADSWALSIKDNDELVTQINASTEGVDILAKKIRLDARNNLEEGYSSIVQITEGITTTVEGLEDGISAIEQTANRVAIEVKDGEGLASSITTSSNAINMISRNINLRGRVTFESFDYSTRKTLNDTAKTATDAATEASDAWTKAFYAEASATGAKSAVDDLMYRNTTYIDGANIYTGTIDADHIRARGVLDGHTITGGSINIGGGDFRVFSTGTLRLGGGRFEVDYLGNLSAASGNFSVPYNGDGIINRFAPPGSSSAARWKYDNNNYIHQDTEGVSLFLGQRTGSGLGRSTVRFQRRGGNINHAFIRLSSAGIKGLGTSSMVQVRDGSDLVYGEIAADDYITSGGVSILRGMRSQLGVQGYHTNMVRMSTGGTLTRPVRKKLDIINGVEVVESVEKPMAVFRSIQDNTKPDTEKIRIGFREDNVPAEIGTNLGDAGGGRGISLQNTVGVLWGAIQELSRKVEELEGRM